MLLAQKDINNYIETYGNILSRGEVEKILRVSQDEEQNGSKGVIADELIDIFLWTNDQPTRAEAFTNFICSRIPIGSRILEVGCGPRADMARRLIFKGMHVTAIDPQLRNPIGSFRREEFTMDYNITPYDAVVGLEPCAAVEPIIRLCIKKHRPFIVAPCGQPHRRMTGELDTNCVAWWNYLKNLHPSIELNYISMAEGYVIPAMSLYTRKILA